MTPPEAIQERRRVLITGASGYVGRMVVRKLARNRERLEHIVATDLELPTPPARLDGIVYASADVRTDALAKLIEAEKIDTVVHLAAIVTPPKDGGRELAYAVDVEGTGKLLEACVTHGVRKIIVTSSGAAYGYHADSSPLLEEDDPLRGNEEFAYAHHKRLVEEMLARYRSEHPQLEQLIFRPGTILGRGTHNQITALFEKPVVVGLREAATPFVFIWDEDVADCIVAGVHTDHVGIYNLAGDGVMTLREIAHALGKPFIALPTKWVQRGLGVMQRYGIGPYGPEQTMFLQYRPVLSNRRLKEQMGYVPRRTTREVFSLYSRGP